MYTKLHLRQLLLLIDLHYYLQNNNVMGGDAISVDLI